MAIFKAFRESRIESLLVGFIIGLLKQGRIMYRGRWQINWQFLLWNPCWGSYSASRRNGRFFPPRSHTPDSVARFPDKMPASASN